MPSLTPTHHHPPPSLSTFLAHLKTHPQPPITRSTALLISLLKRRQIHSALPCALATAQLLLRLVATTRFQNADQLIEKIREVGRRLVEAQPRELSVGNVVRRVLGCVREVVEQAAGSGDDAGGKEVERSGDASPLGVGVVEGEKGRPGLPTNLSGISPLGGAGSGAGVDVLSTRAVLAGGGEEKRPGLASSASYAAASAGAGAGGAGGQAPMLSLLSLLESPLTRSPFATPPAGTQSPAIKPQSPTHPATSPAHPSAAATNLKPEIITAIRELLDELTGASSLIAEHALDHIHAGQTILTHGPSSTIQAFLTTAARKRRFTVVHAESWPNEHHATHATILSGARKGGDADAAGDEAEERWRPLTALGVSVILIPDTAIYALLPRINLVLLSPHALLPNGSLLARAGTETILLAARAHAVPVLALAGIHKLSPLYPFSTASLTEFGDPGAVVGWEEGEWVERDAVVNPVLEWVGAEGVELYVTDAGVFGPGGVGRVVGEYYWGVDGAL